MYTLILGIAISTLVWGLVIVGGNHAIYTSTATDQLSVMVMLCINGFKEIWSLGLIIFGLHLLGLGYLVLTSGFIPKVWGILLLFAAIGYLITNLANLLMPDYENYKSTLEMIFVLPMILGETGLAVWLCVKGGKQPSIRPKF